MSVQERYWKELMQLKFQQFYFDEYLCESYKTNNTINIITAIASSSSIAAWAIWNTLGYIWSLIIALSQLINAIKIYLPFNMRVKALTSACSDTNDLFLKAEYNWYKVSNGDLSSNEINELHYQIKRDNQGIIKKYNIHLYIPENHKLKAIADANTTKYFEENF